MPGRHVADHSTNWIGQSRSRLALRRSEKPATKAGHIRALWPEIAAALEAGQSLKSIRQWLEEDAGIAVRHQPDFLHQPHPASGGPATPQPSHCRICGKGPANGAGFWSSLALATRQLHEWRSIESTTTQPARPSHQGSRETKARYPRDSR